MSGREPNVSHIFIPHLGGTCPQCVETQQTVEQLIARVLVAEADLARVREYADWLLDPKQPKGGNKAFREVCIGLGINLRTMLSGEAS